MILILPGMDGTEELRADFVAKLGMPARIVGYPRDRPLDYRQLEDIARQALPDRPFVIAAESFSGPIGIRLAAEKPSGLRGLVLVGSFARSPLRLPRFMSQLASSFALPWVPQKLAASLLMGRDSTASTQRRIIEAMRSVAPAVWQARLRAVLSADASDALRNVSVPVLCIRAAQDKIIAYGLAQELQGVLPQMQIDDVDGPHFLLMARPDAVAQRVELFARAVDFGNRV
jgi:pimeloyl-ACP methyl ester carboxylesterase